jgi:thymidylate synthase (FAD)
MLNDEQNKSIQSLIEQQNITHRVISSIDNILYTPFPVLDWGFIRVIDYMGNDNSIVQAARISYGDGTKHVSDDKKLINYLMAHEHTTPFEMCEIKLHIKLPIFLMRQWVRHRTANINEYSARYSIVKDEYYLPDFNSIGAQGEENKQGSQDHTTLCKDVKHDWRNRSDLLCLDSFNHYHDALNKSISRETARTTLPLNTYTEIYWKIDLHNLLHFINVRLNNKAQTEMRMYAKILADLVNIWVPITYSAFLNHKKNAIRLSEKSVNALKGILKHSSPQEAMFQGLSKQEKATLKKLFE